MQQLRSFRHARPLLLQETTQVSVALDLLRQTAEGTSIVYLLAKLEVVRAVPQEVMMVCD
eukprot:SAG11_NODE_1306_length_5245_cov_6.023513_6_plen_60_part_00